MADEVEIIGKVRIDDAGATGVLDKLKTGLDGLESKGKSSATALENLHNTTSKLGTAFSVALGNLIAAGIQKAGDAISGFVGSAIDMNSSLEKSTLQFSTLMGSADKAKEHVKFLFDFAAKTPFETQPIIKGSIALQTFGGSALNTQSTLQMVGNAAAAVGADFTEVSTWVGRAYTAIQSGKPFGEAAMRLQELGVLSADARARLEEMQKTGKTGTEVWAAFTSGMDKFSGAMDLQANTWEGLGSTISDNIKMASATALKPFFELLQWGQKILANFLSSKDFQTFLNTVSATLGKVSLIIQTVVEHLTKGDITGAINVIATGLNQLIGPGIGDVFKTVFSFIVEHGEEIKGAIIAIAAAIGGAEIVGAITTFIAAFNPMTLVIGAIVAAVGLLGAAWAGNWGGIRDVAANVWAVIEPVLSTLWGWLQTNIPAALQTLSGFWTGTLLPAISAVGNWITANLLPIFTTAQTWLAANLPGALTLLAGFWNGTLLPAITSAWAFISTNLVPIFTSLGNLLSAVVGAALTVLSALWQGVLLPALTAVYNFISTNLTPVFNTLAGVLGGAFTVAVNVAKGVIDALTGVFNGVRDAVQWVIDRVTEFAATLATIKLPDWLTPGSPTPLENGLWGVARAMSAVAAGSTGVGVGVTAAATYGVNQTTSSITNNYSMQVNGLGEAESLVSRFRLMEAVSRVG